VSGSISVGNVSAPRGERTFGYLNAGTLAGGTEVRIGVQILNGAQDGPTLGLISTLHGWEPVGAEILRRALLRVDPKRLRGRILSVPIANPFSVEFGGTVESAGTVVNPSDQLNLNRSFPGKPKYAWLTERMAYLLFEQVIRQCDAFLDLHDGTGANKMMPVGIFLRPEGLVGDKISELGRALGAPVGNERMDRGQYPGALTIEAARQGIPGITPHMAGGGMIDEYVEPSVECVLNIAKHLGMIDGDPVYPNRQIVVSDYLVYRSSTGGFLYLEEGIGVGATVRKGQIVARILDPLTSEEREVCASPFDGIVTMARIRLPINPGGYVCHIANTDSITWER